MDEVTLSEAYDMLWEIYEPNRDAEKVTITVRNLLDIINKFDDGMGR